MNWNLEEVLSDYRRLGAPGDQNVLISLLKEVQQQFGHIPAPVLGSIADAYGIKESLLLALIRRIPSLRLSGSHVLELCAGPNCGKSTALADHAEALRKKHGFTLKYVPCMRLCGKGPNLRWDGKLYHRATRELLDRLVRPDAFT